MKLWDSIRKVQRESVTRSSVRSYEQEVLVSDVAIEKTCKRLISSLVGMQLRELKNLTPGVCVPVVISDSLTGQENTATLSLKRLDLRPTKSFEPEQKQFQKLTGKLSISV